MLNYRPFEAQEQSGSTVRRSVELRRIGGH